MDLSIESLEDSLLIGMCGFINRSDRHRSAELYLTIGETRYWGRGLAREALTLLTDLGFSHLGLHRIHLTTASGNYRARRAYEAVGFQPEGVLRQSFYRGGLLEDVHVHSLLVTEWKDLPG